MQTHRTLRRKLKTWLHLAYGTATLVRLLPADLLWRSTGGTQSARYCYSVWLRHLVKAASHGMKVPPQTVAELGPGDSIGIGLCALLTGAEQYVALDVVRYADLSQSLPIFEELVQLITQRAPIPGPDEFPEVKPPLDSYAFPSALLTDEIIDAAIAPHRIATIREVLRSSTPSGQIRYMAPWDSVGVIDEASLDFLFSQAVMEHVDDAPHAYRIMQRWLKVGALCSHQVDFKSHDLTMSWDGYRAFPEWKWKLLRGRRPYLINRLPFSAHRDALTAAGFTVLVQEDFRRAPETPRSCLASRWRNMDELDRQASGAYFLASKRTCAA